MLRAGTDLEALERVLRALRTSGGLLQARTLELPVCYDGPDLGDVADHAGLGIDDVVRVYVDRPYRRAFVGFLPGFSYLLGLEGGIRGTSFSSNSTPVITSCLRPSGRGRFMSYAKRPSSSSLNRDDARAPRAP